MFKLEFANSFKEQYVGVKFHCSLLKTQIPDTFGRYEKTLLPTQNQDGM